MYIICPNCKSVYEIPQGVISEEGRQFRCVNCTHEWLATQSNSLEDLEQLGVDLDENQEPSESVTSEDNNNDIINVTSDDNDGKAEGEKQDTLDQNTEKFIDTYYEGIDPDVLLSDTFRMAAREVEKANNHVQGETADERRARIRRRRLQRADLKNEYSDLSLEDVNYLANPEFHNIVEDEAPSNEILDDSEQQNEYSEPEKVLPDVTEADASQQLEAVDATVDEKSTADLKEESVADLKEYFKKDTDVYSSDTDNLEEAEPIKDDQTEDLIAKKVNEAASKIHSDRTSHGSGRTSHESETVKKPSIKIQTDVSEPIEAVSENIPLENEAVEFVHDDRATVVQSSKKTNGFLSGFIATALLLLLLSVLRWASPFLADSFPIIQPYTLIYTEYYDSVVHYIVEWVAQIIALFN